MSSLFNKYDNDMNETVQLNMEKKLDNRMKKKKSLKRIQLILIILISILIVFILLIILLFKIKLSEASLNSILNNSIKNISHIFPKANLNDNYIPTKNQLLESRQLYINEKNLTPEYIQYFKTLSDNEEKIYKKKENEGKSFLNYFDAPREGQLNYSDFYYLCKEEKLLSTEKIKPCYDPFISIILPSYNKAKEILKSIRSIQNQSYKNIEIIIVDDCSTDNYSEIYKYLLDTDPRIRIFYHKKNMGVWRSRLDGFLYSRGKYILHFDPGDFYADNLVLEDAYNLVTQYHLDTIRFSLREVYTTTNIEDKNKTKKIVFDDYLVKILYGRIDFPTLTVHYGSIWNRMTRAAIFTKGLYLLDEYILKL